MNEYRFINSVAPEILCSLSKLNKTKQNKTRMLTMNYSELFTVLRQTEQSKWEGGGQLRRLLHKNPGIFLTIMLL